MPISEPFGTAILLTICGVLLLVSVLSSRASQRIGVPIALFFILVGMLADHDAKKAKRTMDAMMQMRKLDLKKLKEAYDG